MIPALILSSIILFLMIAALIILPIAGLLFTESLQSFIDKHIAKYYSQRIDLIVFGFVAWFLIVICTGLCLWPRGRSLLAFLFHLISFISVCFSFLLVFQWHFTSVMYSLCKLIESDKRRNV